MTIFQSLIANLVILCLVLLAYCKWCFRYWEKKNLPFLQPRVPFGNIGRSICGKENISLITRRIYEEMKLKGWKHGGAFFLTSPQYVPINLDYVKNIMSKDFKFFIDRNVYSNENDPLNSHLVNLSGHKWQNLRTKLNPIFTPGKMRLMFETVVNCQKNLLKKIEEEAVKNEELDIQEILACFTTDVIGSCAFGLDLKSFEREDSPFRIFGKRIMGITRLQRLKRMFAVTFHKLGRFFNIFLTPEDISQYVLKVVKDTVTYRETNNYVRNDLMQQLINLKNNEALTIEELAAQCGIFLLAGSETSSSFMSFVLYELARNENIQEKVRDEIDTVLVKHDGKVTYDSIQDMKYLNQVFDETLRMYPSVPLINRKCVKNYKIPDEDFVLEEGTDVLIPIMGIHYDAEYYADPEKFDPERFSEENKTLRHKYAHLPFGGGPRNCIGMRFALMEAKICISCLIRNYKFSVSRKTREPLQIEPSTLALWAVGKIWLKVQKI